MKPDFLTFWRTYAPQKQFHNRFLVCRKLWDSMDEKDCAAILRELEQQHIREPTTAREKNPYFYLIDWQPASLHWLSPKEVGRLLAEHVPLAVCFNPHTNSFGTTTRTDAEAYGLQVHHYM